MSVPPTPKFIGWLHWNPSPSGIVLQGGILGGGLRLHPYKWSKPLVIEALGKVWLPFGSHKNDGRKVPSSRNRSAADIKSTVPWWWTPQIAELWEINSYCFKLPSLANFVPTPQAHQPGLVFIEVQRTAMGHQWAAAFFHPALAPLSVLPLPWPTLFPPPRCDF